MTKIATFLPVSDEMLEDAPAIQTYLNSRLSMFVKSEEEQQILRGAGVGSNEVEGFIDNYSLNGVGTATVSDNSGTALSEGLFQVMNNQRGSSFLSPDTLIVSPSTFRLMRIAKDTTGQYYGGGPWLGSYGAGGPVSASRFGSGSFWGVNVLVSSVVGGNNGGTALLGAFREGARIARRGGVSVEASNSHASYFRQNLTAIRAESRLALCVLRPEAFTVVRFT